MRSSERSISAMPISANWQSVKIVNNDLILVFIWYSLYVWASDVSRLNNCDKCITVIQAKWSQNKSQEIGVLAQL